MALVNRWRSSASFDQRHDGPLPIGPARSSRKHRDQAPLDRLMRGEEAPAEENKVQQRKEHGRSPPLPETLTRLVAHF